MIYIIHGDDIVKSKNRVYAITQGVKNISTFNAEKANPTEIISAFGSNDLFIDEKCVVIEKVLKLKKADLEKLLDILSNLDKVTTVVLWHNTELSKIFLNKFKNVQSESFLLPKLFFTFLDDLTPKNLKKELTTLSKMEGVEAEQLFYSLVKRVRQLMMVKAGGSFEEIIKMSPWQSQKLQAQARLWNDDQLLSFYKNLFDKEVKFKSSGLFLPLSKHLDILLTQELN